MCVCVMLVGSRDAGANMEKDELKDRLEERRDFFF